MVFFWCVYLLVEDFLVFFFSWKWLLLEEDVCEARRCEARYNPMRKITIPCSYVIYNDISFNIAIYHNVAYSFQRGKTHLDITCLYAYILDAFLVVG